MRTVMVFAAVILAAGPLLAQADPCVRRSVPLNVLNDQGQMVTGLAENNFKGSIHHQPVKVLSVKPDGTARRVVIVIDASGSMLDEKRLWHLYLAVGRNLIAPMPAGTLAGLVVFSSRIEKNIPLTDSKGILQDELTRLEPGLKAFPKGPRQTALWDAVMTAASDFGPSQDGEAIYAITDGGENASKVGENVLREELLRRSIRLFTFSVSTFSGPTLEERSGPLVLKDMVQATGGYAVEIPANVMGTPPAFTRGPDKLTPEGELLMLQFRQIFSFERVEIQFPKPLDKTQEWNLKVKGLKGRDFTVVYPHKLAGCTTLSQSASLSK